MKWRAFLLNLSIGLGSVSPAHSLTVKPIVRLTALGGQYFTETTHSSGANVDWAVVPVVEVNSRLRIIPVVIGFYRETQSVYNFLGENTLILRQLDQNAILRLAWDITPHWRLKPRAGYRSSWVEQGTNEKLGTGLFNNTRTIAGASLERILPNGRFEFGYEYQPTKYPNYQALISDPRLTSTGITNQAGTHVLDYHGHDVALAYELGDVDQRWNLSLNFDWIRQGFTDQKTVLDLGQFEDENRADDIYVLGMQSQWSLSEHWRTQFNLTTMYNTSNQNAFDANQLKFIPRYYNFIDNQLTPSITWSLNDRKWETTLGLIYGYRRYSHRLTQDGSGFYEDKLIYSQNRGASIVVRYRIWKNLFGMLTGNVLTYWSNTRYEVNYPYNYTTYNYLGGLSFEY